MKNSILTLLVLVSGLFLSSCTTAGLATGAGATVGIAAASEGGISGTLSDVRIQAQINELWFSNDIEMFRKLDLTVNQGRVLITGVVQDPKHRVEAVRLAWQPNGVEQVINEVQVAESEGFIGFAKDAWIATRLRTAITLNRDVHSINYNIDVVQGTVYLMGVALSQDELNQVIADARIISGVKGVISYVKLVREVEEAAPDYGAAPPAVDYNYDYAPPVQQQIPQQPQGTLPPPAQQQIPQQPQGTLPPPIPAPNASSGGPVQITPVEAAPLTSEDILWDGPRQGQ